MAKSPSSPLSSLWSQTQAALGSRPAAYWSERAGELAARGAYPQALESYERALRLRPNVPQWLRQRGNVLRHLARFDEAEASLREALTLRPDLAEAHFDLGNVLYSLGRTAEAQASYRTALRLQPDMGRVHFRLGMALLKAGQFEPGWKEFERRWLLDPAIAPTGKPAWNGEPIGERVLLLFTHEDEGYGDTIQFCRYVPQIAPRAGKLIVTARPALLRLLSRLPGVSEVIASGGPLPSFDVHCSHMRLPYIVGTTLQNIPAATPYLAADPNEVAAWRQRLGAPSGLRVGLCWSGQRSRAPGYLAWNHRRSIALETLEPLAKISAVQWISLQTDPPAQDGAARERLQLQDFTADLHDFSDTAALIENLDLVISVDTAVAHLAGALGKPVWLLNPFDACWRWLLDREDSPWYPTLRQFRQPAPWDWQSVISRVHEALQRVAAGDRAPLQASITSLGSYR
jgi:tetratricopeptide (TPR) repeat protein